MGDEDLLEIIGNSKNIGRLQKHFKKMFAGVASITLNEDNSHVTGLLSKEGEEVGSNMILAGLCWYTQIRYMYMRWNIMHGFEIFVVYYVLNVA